MTKARLGALAAAIAGAALLQGCAVVTAPYVAQRAPVTSHISRAPFDRSFFNADGTPPSPRESSLYMPPTRDQGPFFFRFY
ncbi:MAG: hypothetical protein HOQ30_05505 [Gemmatimonadaceae bacterium]|nr:hypothetical protein [Gemmatimonadaceae bacterium]